MAFGSLPTVEARPGLDNLREQFLEAAADPERRTRVLAAGRKISEMCFGCHGEDGNSTNADTPNLAGQDPVYLMVQLRKLEVGLREHDVMKSVVQTMSHEDRFNSSFYFWVQTVKPSASEVQSDAKPGKQLYLTQYCNYCHGTNALGTHAIPRLAGQQPGYLLRAMTQYQARNGERVDPMMSTVLEALSPQDMKNIAEYLSGLEVEP